LMRIGRKRGDLREPKKIFQTKTPVTNHLRCRVGKSEGPLWCLVIEIANERQMKILSPSETSETGKGTSIMQQE
jgi:hypothetical protein